MGRLNNLLNFSAGIIVSVGLSYLVDNGEFNVPYFSPSYVVCGTLLALIAAFTIKELTS